LIRERPQYRWADADPDTDDQRENGNDHELHALPDPSASSGDRWRADLWGKLYLEDAAPGLVARLVLPRAEAAIPASANLSEHG
jgi:hypothetical protein